MLEPHETLGLIDSHHIPGFSSEQQRVLIARTLGFSVKALASQWFISERAVRDQLEPILSAICLPLGAVERDVALAGLWAGRHLCCDQGCLRLGVAAVAEGSLFRAP